MEMQSNRRKVVDLLLLDFNPCQPPVYPLGLEVIVDSVRTAGFEVVLLSASPRLADFADRSCALEEFLPQCIGLQIRNHDLGVAGLRSPRLHEFYPIVVAHLRQLFPGVPIVLGGMGFSIDPEYWIRQAQPDFGIVGCGERAMVLLLESLKRNQGDIDRVPNLVCCNKIRVLPSEFRFETELVAAGRSEKELARWVALRGSTTDSIPWANVEISRGCPYQCNFCVEPKIHGGRLAVKPIGNVLLELEALAKAGVRDVFFCASEFNCDWSHSMALCRALAASGLGKELSWSTYVSPSQLDARLAQEMYLAGCRSVSINAVHVSNSVLEWFHCPHRSRDLPHAIQNFHDTAIECRLTFLIGGPPETDCTIDALFDFIRQQTIRATVAVGVACYPNLALGNKLNKRYCSGSPVPYAIHLSVEQLLRVGQLIAHTPNVQLANQDLKNVLEM
jgi:hypothetical protein